MNEKETVSRGTLWTVLPMLTVLVMETREMLERSRGRNQEFSDYYKSLLREYVRARDEIASVLGIPVNEEMQNEKEV